MTPKTVMLSNDERRTLLRIARAAIGAVLRRESYASDAEPLTPALLEPAGAFVTLHEGGALRGCIGSILPVAPLHRAVAESAVNAAFHDPRFPPLEVHELAHVELEISVMGPLLTVSDPSEIEIGRDGLIVRQGLNAGLLLPQVATDQRWDREQFLDGTCWKAGLPAGCWKQAGVQIQRFSAEVFSEALTSE